MSINVSQQYENRINMPQDYDYVATIPASKTRNVVLTADSASDANISFSTTTPSTRTYVGRNMLLDLTFKLSYNAATATPNPVEEWKRSVVSGLRQWPVSKIITNTSLSINDQTLSMSTGDTINELMRYHINNEERNLYYGGTAHYPDTAYDYDQGQGNRSPFTTFGSVALSEDSRSSEYFNITLENDYFLVRVVEPLFVSPLVFGKAGDDEAYLVGIQNIGVNLTLARLQKLWSGQLVGILSPGLTTLFNSTAAANAQLFNVSLAESSKQRLHLTYKTPPPQQVVPRMVSYNYNNVRRFTQRASQTLLPAASNSFQMNNITLSSVPSRVYVYARPLVGLSDFRYADFHTRITKLSLLWDNQEGLLQGMSDDGYDLHMQNVRAGYNESFRMTKAKGNVVCIDFANGDVSMAALSATGVRGNYNMGLNITMSDVRDPNEVGAATIPSDAALEYEINIVVIENGVLQINDSLVSVSVGLLSSSILANAPFNEMPLDNKAVNFYGSGVKDVLKTVLKMVKKALPVVTDVANAVSSVPGAIGTAARGVAIGSELASNVLGKGLQRRGGKLLTQRDLSRRL